MKLSFATSLLLTTAWAVPHPQAGSTSAEASDSNSNSPVQCEPFYPDQAILDALAGTYALINTTSARDGVPIPDEAYGERPVGIITYSKSGWMSATITATEPELRPNLTFPFQPEDSDDDWALVGKHSIGYAGPITISRDIPANTTSGQIFHGPLVVANVPSWQGALQRRNYTIHTTPEGKLLHIQSTRGGGFTGELWWRKVD
ncbi:hypothetical protein CB0940_08030 [Cercospora beticola]|uniref:Lipocalin-like domain-containing protein n=1 Tax=Cercospora beticola TaxID=122368 RepID=A0A2G5HQB7_CERBT|nr:hypothetical protein CB0940_08030 [Cercospora beticola]PIA94720.1 hypothetical protein CB0940_08030 [Cercospora beticola]WPB04586.1 hypothetical protein RHO25_009232 [Cercospora beticola]CAK1364330.1 unnamed protein product [Cercospora beticola]